VLRGGKKRRSFGRLVSRIRWKKWGKKMARLTEKGKGRPEFEGEYREGGKKGDGCISGEETEYLGS